MKDNEVRLIDANALIKNYLNHCRTEFETKNKCMADENVIAIIDNAPTINHSLFYKQGLEDGKLILFNAIMERLEEKKRRREENEEDQRQ